MTAADTSDEYLMSRVAHGEPEQLEILLRRHAPRLLAFLVRMVGDRHRSEELFQEVFLAIWMHRSRYEYPRPFKPWLYTIAVNKCRESFRGRRPATLPLAETNGVCAAPSPPEALIAAEEAALVAEAVAQLPEQQRSVVLLRVWEMLSYADIADIVGCTEATVRSHMHHGLAGLRRYLQQRLGKVQETSIGVGRTD
jgi:RNA polymerase sigma-70 factor (ECF subfamily)